MFVGQQLVKLPDGRLQLITVQSTSQPTASTPTVTPASPLRTIQLRPQLAQAAGTPSQTVTINPQAQSGTPQTVTVPQLAAAVASKAATPAGIATPKPQIQVGGSKVLTLTPGICFF